MSQKGNKSKKESVNPYSKGLGKDGLVVGLRGKLITREFLISTLLGLAVVIGIKFVESPLVILGMIAGLFVLYYITANRKSKLSSMGDGSMSYYTETVTNQVVKVKHYDRYGIKRELYAFGVTNIVFIELLGVSIILSSGWKYEFVVTAVGIIAYILIINNIMSEYTVKVEKELDEAITKLNTGVNIELTDVEQEELKQRLGVDNTLFATNHVGLVEDTTEDEPEEEQHHETENTKKVYQEEYTYIYSNGVLTTEDSAVKAKLEEINSKEGDSYGSEMGTEEATTVGKEAREEQAEVRDEEGTTEEGTTEEGTTEEGTTEGDTEEEVEVVEDEEVVVEEVVEEVDESGVEDTPEEPVTKDEVVVYAKVEEDDVTEDENILENIQVLSDIGLTRKTNDL